MKRAVPLVVGSLLVGLGGWGAVARAQQPMPALRLELAVTPMAPAVVPSASPEVIQRDTEEAIALIQQRQRDEEILRETIRRPDPRPHLHYDVVNGIQSRNIQDALRRR